MRGWSWVGRRYGSALDVLFCAGSTAIFVVSFLSGVEIASWAISLNFVVAFLLIVLVGIRLSEVSEGGKHNLAVIALLWLCAVTLVLFAYSSVYAQVGLLETGSATVQHDVYTALYFSIVTFTTLGYGDVRPLPADRFLAASEALVGYVLLAATIGTVWRILGLWADALKGKP